MKKIVKVTTTGGQRNHISIDISGQMVDIFVSGRYRMPDYHIALASIVFGLCKMLTKEQFTEALTYKRHSPYKVSETYGMSGRRDIFLVVEEVCKINEIDYIQTGLTFKTNSLHCSCEGKWNSFRESFFLPDLLLLLDAECKRHDTCLGSSLVDLIKRIKNVPEEIGIESLELVDTPEDLQVPNGVPQFSCDQIDGFCEALDDIGTFQEETSEEEAA